MRKLLKARCGLPPCETNTESWSSVHWEKCLHIPRNAKAQRPHFPLTFYQWLPMEWLTVSALWPHNRTCGVVWITRIYVIAQEKKGGAILSPMCVLHETRYSQHDYSNDVWSPSVACRKKIKSFSIKKCKIFTPFAHSFQDQYELSIKFFKINALLFWSLLSSLVVILVVFSSM